MSGFQTGDLSRILSGLPDEYSRLGYLIGQYLIEAEPKSDDPLLLEFKKQDSSLDNHANIPSLVCGYCEQRCTRFPVDLVIADTGFKQYLVTHISQAISDEDPNKTYEKKTPQEVLAYLGFEYEAQITNGIIHKYKKLTSFIDDINQEVANGLPLYSLNTLNQLREKIEQHFNLDDLRTVCYDLGVSFDNLPGDTLSRKSQELVDYCRRHNVVNTLISILMRTRPKVQFDLHADTSPNETDESFPKRDEETIRYLAESLKHLVSFYGRWLQQNCASSSVMDILCREKDPDLFTLCYALRELNRVIFSDNNLSARFTSIFGRNEVVSIEETENLIKHIHAYEHRYMKTKKRSDPSAKVTVSHNSENIEDLLKLIIAIRDYLNWLRHEKIMPEIVIILRRMTTADGSTRLDYLSEDSERGKPKLVRFTEFVKFYNQVECFLHLPEPPPDDISSRLFLSTLPVIMPVDWQGSYIEV